MKNVGTLVVATLLVAIMAVAAAWLYPQLPAQAPSHWNLEGAVDGWAPKAWVVGVPLLAAIGLAVLIWLLPAISPRRFGIAPFRRVYDILMLTIMAVMVVVFVCTWFAGAGYQVDVGVVALVAVGVLLVVMGNFMGKLRKNFFVGIRTPWTLASDAVWERTHRMAGWLFMLAGVLLVVAALVRVPPGAIIAIVVVLALVPAVYSYIAYRRLEGHPQTGGPRA